MSMPASNAFEDSQGCCYIEECCIHQARRSCQGNIRPVAILLHSFVEEAVSADGIWLSEPTPWSVLKEQRESALASREDEVESI